MMTFTVLFVLAAPSQPNVTGCAGSSSFDRATPYGLTQMTKEYVTVGVKQRQFDCGSGISPGVIYPVLPPAPFTLLPGASSDVALSFDLGSLSLLWQSVDNGNTIDSLRLPDVFSFAATSSPLLHYNWVAWQKDTLLTCGAPCRSSHTNIPTQTSVQCPDGIEIVSATISADGTTAAGFLSTSASDGFIPFFVDAQGNAACASEKAESHSGASLKITVTGDIVAFDNEALGFPNVFVWRTSVTGEAPSALFPYLAADAVIRHPKFAGDHLAFQFHQPFHTDPLKMELLTVPLAFVSASPQVRENQVDACIRGGPSSDKVMWAPNPDEYAYSVYSIYPGYGGGANFIASMNDFNGVETLHVACFP